MFKFYVGLAGQEKVSDNSRTTMCKRNIKAHHWIQKVQKTKDIQKAWVLMGKQFEDFRQKKTETLFSTFQKNPMKHTAVKYNNWIWPLQTVKIKLNKTWKKAFTSKLLELCKTRAKKSSPDMFNFYVDFAGHDIATETDRATTCRRKFKAPSLQTYITKKRRTSRKRGVLTGKSLKISDEKKNRNINLDLLKTPSGIKSP